MSAVASDLGNGGNYQQHKNLYMDRLVKSLSFNSRYWINKWYYGKRHLVSPVAPGLRPDYFCFIKPTLFNSVFYLGVCNISFSSEGDMG